MADNPKFPNPDPLAPGGVLDPSKDINDKANVDADVPSNDYVPPEGPTPTPPPPDYNPPGSPEPSPVPPDYEPPLGPSPTPVPPDYSPADGPDATPVPPDYVPQDGPTQGAVPPDYTPPEGPEPTGEPQDYVPPEGPEPTVGPADYQPTDQIQVQPDCGPRYEDIMNALISNSDAHTQSSALKALIPPADSKKLAESGILDPRNDINLASNLLNDNIASILGGIVNISIDDIGDAFQDPDLVRASIGKLGKDLSVRGLQVVGALAIKSKQQFSNVIDEYIIGKNKWSPISEYEDHHKQGNSDLQKRPIESVNDAITNIRKKILGSNAQTPPEYELSPNHDLSGDGHISEADTKTFSRVNLEDFLKTYNLYSPTQTYEKEPAFSQRDFLPEGEDDTVVKLAPDLDQKEKSKTFNLDGLFNSKGSKLGKAKTVTGRKSAKAANDINDLKKSSFYAGIIPASFKKDLEDGSILVGAGKSPSEIITDNEAYVPLSFHDIRPATGNEGKTRAVYFRPIITSFSEDISPEWDKKTYFGRSDKVVTYMSTIRTITLSFELHAFRPEDVEINWKKLAWLKSMTYPQYGKDFLMKAGPVCRLRVGDAISVGNRLGLPGIIDSLSFDYSDSLWELEDGKKVPRSIVCSLAFHALHEKPIGTNEQGYFGGLGSIDEKGNYSFTENFDSKDFQGFGDISKSIKNKSPSKQTKLEEGND